MTFENPSQNQIFDILKQAKNIAVVGLSNKPDRTSYKIAEILQQHGYRVLPVNPVLKGETVLGETVYGTLTSFGGVIFCQRWPQKHKKQKRLSFGPN